MESVERGGATVARPRTGRRWLASAKWLLLAALLVAAGAAAAFVFLRPVSVTIAAVIRRDIAPAIQGVGTVEAKVAVQVGSKITGRLVAVLVDQGDTVTAGQVLARLDNVQQQAEVARQEAAVRAAEASVAEAQANVRRAQSTLDDLVAGSRPAEQQRLAVARAVVNDPAVILADEPTASLDTQRGKAVMDLLRQLGREREAAVIAVTHDERMIEGFDRVYHMVDGRIDRS